MELAACNNSGAKKFDVAPKILEKIFAPLLYSSKLLSSFISDIFKVIVRQNGGKI